MAFPVHVHMPRQACGYALATTPARSSPTWGHGNIRHTVLYTELAPEPRKR